MANPFKKIPQVNEGELVCKLGDRLVVRAAATTEEGEEVKIGALYEVVGRVGYGWDLRQVQGGGAPVLRILNSRLLSLFDRQIASS